MIGRTRCEVFSRVCGYLRPVSNWNEGKQAEWNDRKTFKNNEKEKKCSSEIIGLD